MANDTAVKQEPDSRAGVKEIEKDLEFTREQLGETVQELTDRLSDKARPLAFGVGALAVVALMVTAVVVVRRWRHKETPALR